MTPTQWIDAENGHQRCTKCDATFPRGHSCNCPVGSPSPDASDDVTGTASHSLPQNGEGLPTTSAYEHRARSIADEMRRIRNLVEQLTEGDISPDEIDAKTGAYRLVAQLLDMERKATSDTHRMARERELPEIADRMERTVKKARERGQANDTEGDVH